MLALALRNIFRHTARTALTLSAIAFGVSALVVSGGFVEDIFIQLRETTIHSRLGHLQVYRAGYYTHGRRDPYGYMIQEPHNSVITFTALPHVNDVMLRLNFSGLLNNSRTDLPIVGEGIEPDKESRLGSSLSIASGRQLSAQDQYGILVGQGAARSLGLAPGDYVTLVANTSAGALNSLDLEVVGTFRTFAKDYDARAVRILLESAQELLDTPAVHGLVFALDDTQATDAVAKLVEEQLPAGAFEVKTWEELDDFYQKTVGLYRRQFGVLQLIVLGILVLSVMNTVNMTVFERTGEFGTLRALGRQGSYIFKLVLTENTVLGLLGAGLGAGLGLLLAWSISQVGIPMPPPPNAETGYTALIRIVPSVVASASLTGLLAAMLAAIPPALGIMRLPIVDALRRSI